MEHDKLLCRGEAQVRQLGTELQVKGSGTVNLEGGPHSYIPERDEQRTKEVHRLTTTVANQQDKIKKLQKDAVEDAKAIHEYLNQLNGR